MTARFRALATMACGALLLPMAAWAAGDHAGGHGSAGGETAIGKPGVAARATRTVTVDMADSMRFTPSDIPVRQGETVRFVVRNSGKLKHELSLGTEKDLQAHRDAMKKYPDMVHDDPSSVSLAPGRQGQIVWQFTRAGTVHFACLVPGHSEAGMKGAVRVAKP